MSAELRLCATCRNTGVVEVELEDGERKQKLCPTCGGSSNPAMLAEIKARQEEERRYYAAVGRATADQRKRKRERAKRARQSRKGNR